MPILNVERRRGNQRRDSRQQETIRISYADGNGKSVMLYGKVMDVSMTGVGIQTASEIPCGTIVRIACTAEIEDGPDLRDASAEVRWAVSAGAGKWKIGLMLVAHAQEKPAGAESESKAEVSGPGFGAPDFYEVLQLSPNADFDTIHRVARLLAARYHPDNVETGNDECFRRVMEASTVLGDPVRRASYDATVARQQRPSIHLFESSESTFGAQAELRKRQGILKLLYYRRLRQPEQPWLTTRDVEELLSVPKEHLEFPFWYLRENELIRRSDNGRYIITVKGVDQAESDEMKSMLPKLMIPAPAPVAAD